MRTQNATCKRRGGFFKALMSLALLLCGLYLTGTVTQAEIIPVVNETADDYSLADAFKYANKGDVLTLHENIALGAYIAVEKGVDVTLNLNGYNIDLNGYNIWNGGKLTVINEHEEGAANPLYFMYSSNNDVYVPIKNPTAEQKQKAVDPATIKEEEPSLIIKLDGGIIYNGVGYGEGIGNHGGAFINTTFDSYETSGDLSISNVSFVCCKAYRGGVIDNESGNLTLTNVQAYSCSANDGGVVSNVVGNTMTIKDCTFGLNIAEGIGGAVLNYGNATITGLNTFMSISGLQGGAICNGVSSCPNAEMQLKDSVIENTICMLHGGAIANYGILSAGETSITNTKAKAGGAIFNYNKLNLKDCVIRDCEADNYGGAIFNDGIGTHHDEPAKATDTITTLDGVRIENCKSLKHKNDEETENAPTWDESVYVRNSSLVIKDSYVENPIFLRNNPYYTENGKEFNNFPACSINIISGVFKNMNLEVLRQDGAAVVSNKKMGLMYLFEKTFNAALDPADGSAGWDEKVNATLKADANADTYKIISFDKENDTWEVLADEIKAKDGTGTFTFEAPENAEKSINYRAFAIKNGVPYALSEAFTITWKKPAEKKEDKKEDKKEEKTVAVKDKVVDETTGNTFVVTSTGTKNEVALQEVVVKKGTVTIPDSVQIGGVTYAVTALDKSAFKKASSMKTLDLGVNISKLFKGAFKNCKKLKVIKIRNKKKVIALNKNMFGKIKGKITLKVDKKLVKKYKAAVKKSKLTKKIKIAKL